MVVNQGSKILESPIFEDLGLYKVIKTPQNRLNLLHHDGSVSIIIPFEGINNTSMNEQDFEMMFQKIQTNMDKIFDPNICVQFIMTRSNDVAYDQTDRLPSYLRPRASYIKSLAENYKVFRNKFYFCILYSNTNEQKKKTFMDYMNDFLNKDTFKEKNFMSNITGLAERVSKLSAATETFINLFGTSPVNLRFKMLKEAQGYWDVIQEFTSPKSSRVGKLKIDQDKESPRKALFSGRRAEVNKSHFILDDYYHKVFTLDRAPRQEIFGKHIDILESVDFELIYSVTFRMMSDKEAIDTIEFRLFNEALKAGTNKDRIIRTKSLDVQLERLDEEYEKFVRSEGRGVQASIVLVLRMSNKYIDDMSKANFISREEFLRQKEDLLYKNVFNSYGLSEWIGEPNTQWKIFNNILPGCSNIRTPILRKTMLSSKDIPYCLAMYDSQRPKIKHIGTNHFIDHRGNLFYFELKDPELAAHNYLISGTTGSGKSVLINALLTMQFSEQGNPPVICILDVGGDRGSYKKIMTLAKGQEINLSGPTKPTIQMFDLNPETSKPTPNKIEQLVETLISLGVKDGNEAAIRDSVVTFYTKVLDEGRNNITSFRMEEIFLETFEMELPEKVKKMFFLKKGECEPSEGKMNLIKSVLDIILSSNKKIVDGLAVFDEDTITLVLYRVYRRLGAEENRYPKMSDLYKEFEMYFSEGYEPGDDGRIHLSAMQNKLLTRLQNWTSKGQYPMFDRETDLDISGNVILADLKGLNFDKQLQQIYTMLISEMFSDKMYYIKDRRKVLVRDEAWSLMQNDKARQYFVEDMRTARKNGFITLTASQGPLDYLNPSPEDGRAVLNNAQVKIFCRVESPSLADEVIKEFNVPEEMKSRLMELGVRKEYTPDGNLVATYADFLMVASYNGKQNYFILKNQLHPFEYNLYSSSPEDNALIDYYMRVQNKKKFEDLEEVLWFITRGAHIGDYDLWKYLIQIGEKDMAERVKSHNDFRM